MDTTRVDLLIQYALAVAAGNDWGDRELRPIHLIKFVYLADLDYASRHQGKTFTGIKWQFYRFGPWSAEVFHRIEPALAAIGAEKNVRPSKKYDDAETWRCTDEKLCDELESSLDFLTALAVKNYVREYGSDTETLLHDVYRTPPMLHAAPNELLDFTKAVIVITSSKENIQTKELTIKQRKKNAAKLETLRKGVAERLAKKRDLLSKRTSHQPVPRYDDIFFQGVEVLENISGDEIAPSKITCSFSDDFWKSKARYDPDLS